MIQKFDFLIIGSGIAGMSFALKSSTQRKSGAHMQNRIGGGKYLFRTGWRSLGNQHVGRQL